MKRKKKRVKDLPASVLIFIIVSLLCLYIGPDFLEKPGPVAGSAEFHFIDVGQGDAALIRAEGANILIDGGDISAQNTLIEYLNAEGIKKLDLMVGTHPHSDHIGGLVPVVRQLEIDQIIMPRADHTSAVYQELLTSIQEKGLKITSPASGEAIQIGPLEILALGPVRDNYGDLNNMSVILKISFGDISFLFTGDGEKDAEADILGTGLNVNAQVLKVGHHGSVSSTSYDFLEAVNPDIAVISCKLDNEYGHPHQEVLDRLKAAGITVYRTDLMGDIILVTDGKSIERKTTQ